MNVTFRQLRLFAELAEQLSISAVARSFHVTQPTVSMQMRELTDEIGLPLYEVIGKKIFLTQAGEELAKTARAVADEWASFGQRIDSLKGYQRGRLRVAVVSTAKYFIPRLLENFVVTFLKSILHWKCRTAMVFCNDYAITATTSTSCLPHRKILTLYSRSFCPIRLL
jgi:DNA-binding transcriptional LysR family regulator